MMTTTRTSDVKAHRSCPRAWYYRAVVDVATSTGQAAKKGTGAHAEVERWLQYGAAPASKAGRLLVQGLQRLAELPALGALLGPGAASAAGWPGECEWHWTVDLPMPGGTVLYHGTADLVLWSVDVDGGDPVPVIIDHKTRGQLDWSPTAEQLAEDWQAAAYAMAVIRKTGARVLYFIHNNICERDRLVRPVAVRLEADHVAALWRQVVAHVETMTVHAKAARAEDVPVDVTGVACGEYGGCPYRNRCTYYTKIMGAGRALQEAPMALISKPAPAASTPTASVAAPAPSADQRDPPVAHDQVRIDPTTGEVHEAGGYHLYVNCAPLPRRGVQLDDLVSLDQRMSELAAFVCNKRSIDHYSQGKYGEAKADILAMLAVNLPPAGMSVIIDTADELQRAALDVLLPHAATVVRGWK